MPSVPPPSLEPPPGPPLSDLPELPAGAPRPSREPGWAPWTAPVALLTAFAGAIAGAIVIGGIAAGAGSGLTDRSPDVVLASTFVQDLALVLSALLFARMWRSPRPGDFGLRRAPLPSWLKGVALGWLAFFVFGLAWTALVGGSEKDNLPKELGADRGTAAMLAVAFLVTVIAPIAEEFFFRGYFFGAVRNLRGPWVAAVITGVIFGAIHLGSSPAVFLVPLAFFGFVLCVVRMRTGSLYPCIALHALNNSIAFGVTQHWGWQIPVLLVASYVVIGAVVWPTARAWAGASGRRNAFGLR
jgi:membrane protease YdiL (CAAX protease family)